MMPHVYAVEEGEDEYEHTGDRPQRDVVAVYATERAAWDAVAELSAEFAARVSASDRVAPVMLISKSLRHGVRKIAVNGA